MKFTPSISSATKLTTLSMALLTVLTSINIPTAHAAPVIKAAAPALNGIQQFNQETPKVPMGLQGPLLNRRGINIVNNKGLGLGEMHPTAPERPGSSGRGEIDLVSTDIIVSDVKKKKRHDWEHEGEDVAAAAGIKRDDSEEEKWTQLSSKP